MDTPLSAVSTILVLPFLNSLIAHYSSLEMLVLLLVFFFKIALISPLSSSALPVFSFKHAFSMTTMYSHIAGSLGTTT